MTAALWHAADDRALRTHDLTLTAGFWGSLGFAIDLAGGGLSLRRGGVALSYVEQAGLDPWSAAVATARVEVTNAELLHAELWDADVMPDVGAAGRPAPEAGVGPGAGRGSAGPVAVAAAAAGDAAELRARWDADRDVSRLGPLESAAGRTSFAIWDPSGNRLVCSSPA